ncbi:MAG: protein kinase [Cyanobacteria bacterium SZAS LIN-5]|nr:protein kinase [Cyanobacteria bacterium SZAS LIN-5]RTL45197.1 MAG: serine/threonine protein kinase [Candidatus Melainabacteria bacterium]
MKLCLLCSSKYDDTVSVCERDGAKLVIAGSDNLIGTVVGEKYHIDELIGKGSVGRVYKAHRVADNSFVAVKVLRENLSNDKEALARFKREAQMLSIIEHPNIVELYDFGQTAGGEPFFAAEYLDGKTLATIIAERRCLTVSEAHPIFSQVFSALAEAHSHGFIHRDIKPTNIILVENQDQPLVKILDFSLAKLPPLAVEDRVTEDGMLRGTPAYMSPEQCQSMEVDNRSDIYSLAVVLFESLTGLRPFSNKNSVITMHQQMNDMPPTLMAVRSDLQFCEELEVLIAQCLSKKPEGRPASVEEFRQKFEQACEAQKRIAELEISSGYAERPRVKTLDKLTPLEAFREADERRKELDKILADESSARKLTELRAEKIRADESESETIRMTTAELESQRVTAVNEMDNRDKNRAENRVEGKAENRAENRLDRAVNGLNSVPAEHEPGFDLTTAPVHLRLASFVLSMWWSPVGRKVILGLLVFVLLIILVTTLLLTPIPGPSTP